MYVCRVTIRNCILITLKVTGSGSVCVCVNGTMAYLDLHALDLTGSDVILSGDDVIDTRISCR